MGQSLRAIEQGVASSLREATPNKSHAVIYPLFFYLCTQFNQSSQQSHANHRRGILLLPEVREGLVG